MSEETKKDAVSDDALDEAYKKTTDEKADATESKEGASSETKTEEKSEFDLQKEINDLRAEIGRGGKALNEVESLKNEISGLKSLLETQATQKQTEQETESIVTTEADVRKVFNNLQTEQQRNQQKYTDDYYNEVTKLAVAEGMTDEQMLELENVLKTSITGSRSNFTNSVMDAEINFNKAMRVLEKSDKKSVNLKGDKPKGTGIGNATNNQTKDNISLPDNIDPEAKEYMDMLVASGKMTIEQAAKALRK
jgi:hypothetical protein